MKSIKKYNKISCFTAKREYYMNNTEIYNIRQMTEYVLLQYGYHRALHNSVTHKPATLLARAGLAMSVQRRASQSSYLPYSSSINPHACGGSKFLFSPRHFEDGG